MAHGELAVRLLAALEAAEQEGGEIRGQQAASLIVVSGRPSGVAKLDRLVDLCVDDHPNPQGEISRLLNYSRAHQCAEQAIEKVLGGHFAEALANLDACCAKYPDEPEFLFRRALVLLLQLGRTDEARDVLSQAEAVHPGWSELALRFADAEMIPVRREELKTIAGGLTPKNTTRSNTLEEQ